MTKIEKLIAEHCPDGVERKKLKEVARIQRGVRVVRSQLVENGDVPVYQNSLKPLGFCSESNCKAGTAFVIAAGAAGEIGYSDIDFWAADDCYCVLGDESLNGRFVYYCLKSQQFSLESKVRKGAVPRLERSFIEDLEIPVPPLPVQAEVVRMLDGMAGLIDALESELAARRQQYEYYREKLLAFD